MASVNELINLHQYQYGRPQGGESAFGTLVNEIQKKKQMEDQREYAAQLLKDELKREQEKEERVFNRQKELIAEKQKAVLDTERRKRAIGLERVGIPTEKDLTNGGVVSEMDGPQGERRKVTAIPSKQTPIRKGNYVAKKLDEYGVPKEYVLDEETPEEKKFAISQEENQRLKETKSQNVKNSALATLGTITEIEKGMNHFGMLGGVPSIPGTERANWEANVNKLMAEQVLKIMNDLKSASKTGATGFGQLSNRELELLQNSATALKKTLSPKDAQRYLDQIRVPLNKILQIENSQEDTGSFSYLWE